MDEDVLQFVYEYRKLLARKGMLNQRLDGASAERLTALEKLFAPGPDDGPHHRRYARCPVSLRATVKAGGRVQPVLIVNVGGGGLCVSPAPSLRSGERAVVRVFDPTSRSTYHYPVHASWVRSGAQGPSFMGMPFVGAPLHVATPTA